MKKSSFLFLILFFASQSKSISQESSLNISADYGQYDVGFKTFNEYDKTRSFSIDVNRKTIEKGETITRPLQICVWYPANDEGKDPMKYEDYFFLKASETGKVEITDELKNNIKSKFLETDPVEPTILENELNAKMRAFKNAAYNKSNKFPVIIYGPSWWSTAFENALLCEFLASHGFIVLSSPSVGPETREMPISRIGIETQARDMEFLLSMAYEIPNANLNKIAVAGYSLGGLSNVIMLARNISIDAWIGIDPSIHEAYDLFKESPYEDYSRFTRPMLFINSLGYMNSLPFYDRLIYSDAYMVNFPELQHTDMASQFIKLFGSNDKKVNVDKRIRGYNSMSEYILSFLNGVLKENLSYNEMSTKLLANKEIDTSFITILHKKGLPIAKDLFFQHKGAKGKGLIPFLNKVTAKDGISNYPEADLQKLIFLASKNNFMVTANDLMKWYRLNYKNTFHEKVLAYINFEEMLNMFTVIYDDNKGCEFDYYQLNHTAQVMSMGGKVKEAMPFFILNTELHPNNYQAFFNLGIGYFRANDLNKAKENFQKCLELEPDDRFSAMAKDMIAKCK